MIQNVPLPVVATAAAEWAPADILRFLARCLAAADARMRAPRTTGPRPRIKGVRLFDWVGSLENTGSRPHAALIRAIWARGPRGGRETHAKADWIIVDPRVFRFGYCRGRADSIVDCRGAVRRYLSVGLFGEGQSNLYGEERADGPMSGSESGAASYRERSGALHHRHRLPAQRNGRVRGRPGDARTRTPQQQQRRLCAARYNRQRQYRWRWHGTGTPDQSLL